VWLRRRRGDAPARARVPRLLTGRALHTRRFGLPCEESTTWAAGRDARTIPVGRRPQLHKHMLHEESSYSYTTHRVRDGSGVPASPLLTSVTSMQNASSMHTSWRGRLILHHMQPSEEKERRTMTYCTCKRRRHAHSESGLWSLRRLCALRPAPER
jgi:hypothetical protein